MPYFCATVKVLVEDPDLEHASETIREALNSLRDESNCISDWGFCSHIPNDKGPFPRLISPELGQAYTEGRERLLDIVDNNRGEPNRESQDLEEELEQMFTRL